MVEYLRVFGHVGFFVSGLKQLSPSARKNFHVHRVLQRCGYRCLLLPLASVVLTVAELVRQFRVSKERFLDGAGGG